MYINKKYIEERKDRINKLIDRAKKQGMVKVINPKNGWVTPYPTLTGKFTTIK